MEKARGDAAVEMAVAEWERWLRDERFGAVVTGCDAALRHRASHPLVRAKALRFRGLALWRLNPVLFAGQAISGWRDALDLHHHDTIERAKTACLLAGAYADPALAKQYAELIESLGCEVQSLAIAAWLNAGLAYHRTLRLPEAEAAYMRALELREGVHSLDTVVPAGALEINLAGVLIDCGRTAEAVQWLDRAQTQLSMNELGASYLEMRARAECQAGDLVVAAQLVEMAMEHPSAGERSRTEALWTRARVLRAAGDAAGARDTAHEAFLRAGRIGYAWVCDRVTRDLDEAEEAVQCENG